VIFALTHSPRFVIPGRAEGASPESMTTDRAKEDAVADNVPNVVVMDSGPAGSARVPE